VVLFIKKRGGHLLGRKHRWKPPRFLKTNPKGNPLRGIKKTPMCFPQESVEKTPKDLKTFLTQKRGEKCKKSFEKE